jgi:segregation and condensation protein B
LAHSQHDPEARVEALLYAAGRPLDLDELARLSGVGSKKRVLAIARNVARRINSTCKAIEVLEYPGPKFVLQLNQEFTRLATSVSGRRLLPPSVLTTLAYVSFYQPVAGREIALKRGTHVYTHLKILETMGLISHRKVGKQRLYVTTPLFSRYWGLSDKPEELKKQLLQLRTVRKPGKEFNGVVEQASG